VLSSRRDADIYNSTGNVNGIPVVEMGHMVKPGDVNFDGAVLTPEKRFIFY
jgi:23S rRNA pseudouridine2605 synthase